MFFPVLRFALTIIHGCGRAAKNGPPPFRIRVLLSMQNKEQKNQGRPGNEARFLVHKKQLHSSTN